MDDVFTIDLPKLSLVAIISLAAILGFVDTAWNVLLSLAHGDFSAEYVTKFLVSHVGLVLFPIAAAAVIGNGIPALEIPPLPAVTLVAEGGLVAYLVKVVVSLKDATRSTSVPAAEAKTAPG